MNIKTRNNGLMLPGFYKKFLHPKVPKCYTIKVSRKSKIIRLTELDDTAKLINQLKYLVLGHFKGKKLIKSGKIVLTCRTLSFLKRNYGINSYFRSCINILNDYIIPRLRFMSETDFCEIIEFFGRIHQPRKFNFLASDIYSSPFFSFKY
jgi:hypothetical protein